MAANLYKNAVHIYLFNTVNNFASGNLQNLDSWPRGAKDVLFIMAYLHTRNGKQNYKPDKIVI